MILLFHGRSLEARPADSLRRKVFAVLPDVKTEWAGGVFRLRDRLGLQFHGEFFNLFNHPQFDLPNAIIGNPNAGRISATVGITRGYSV
jgi:hypothetical protein